METYLRKREITVRSMKPEDCKVLAEGFAAQGWTDKTEEQYERYLAEQEAGVRKVFIGEWLGEAAGYVTLLPEAAAGPFQGTGWPELCDFNVLEKFQRRGVGSCILDAAEAEAAKVSGTVCLGVGLYGISGAAGGYGTAQRLYVKRGYVPDGSGVWYRDRQLPPYEACCNDDSLVLYLAKELRTEEA